MPLTSPFSAEILVKNHNLFVWKIALLLTLFRSICFLWINMLFCGSLYLVCTDFLKFISCHLMSMNYVLVYTSSRFSVFVFWEYMCSLIRCKLIFFKSFIAQITLIFKCKRKSVFHNFLSFVPIAPHFNSGLLFIFLLVFYLVNISLNTNISTIQAELFFLAQITPIFNCIKQTFMVSPSF